MEKFAGMRGHLTIAFIFIFNLSSYCQYTPSLPIDSLLANQIGVDQQTSIPPLYFKSPNLLISLGRIPSNLYDIAVSPFQGKNWIWLSGIAVSTLLIVPQDQKTLDWVRSASRKIGLNDTVKYNLILKLGDTKIIKLPKNLNTAFYQLGEGGTSILLAAGLFAYGKIKKDWRAEQTSYDLAETFVTMGITTQILKRISGRESPFTATAPGGRWSPLPSFKEYQNNTSTYDAFPSGHLATMVATVTVLTNNYPEKKWIKPVGYSLCGLTAWAMMNTEVHWLSDYPLAIAIGYLAGKITTMRHRKPQQEAKKIVF